MKNTLDNGQGSRIQLCCERSGHHTIHRGKNYVPKTTITKKRKCGTIKCNCPFRLNGSCNKYGIWKLRVGCGYHNHQLPTTLVGHGYAGRLEEKEKMEVQKLTESGCRPREILTTLKKDNPKNCSTMRTIYNERRKLKMYAMQGRSMIQHFFKLAQEHHYTVENKYDPMTKKVTDLFFSHPVSVKLAQCFHEFLLLDCTYKTNIYKLLLFHVVSHTSTGATFTVAVAFMSREKEANYIWALECIKRLYRKNEIPSVFVTDCEVGLISAIHHVFPKSSHLLCAWHIGKNVYAHGKCYFKLKPATATANDKDRPKKIDTVIPRKKEKGKQKEKQDEKKKELKKWYEAWKDVVTSPSEDEYKKNLNKFVSTWEPKCKDVVRYVIKTWLDPYKEKFVSAWTDKIKHFNNIATSRVESAHAKLKLYLGNSRGNFFNCFLRAHCSYENEHVHVEAEFERSKTRQMHDHRLENLFQGILNFVSIKALKILYDEIHKNVDVGSMNVTCNCLARTVNGLPCACEIGALKRQGKVIPLNIIDPFWRKLSSSPPSPSRINLPFEETPEFFAIRDTWERATENEQKYPKCIEGRSPRRN
ncbi:uncharacterized protein LOC113361060 [Papaver somniferum]|uniref:uncharacterized protein LOC113361060 n=1 Tax=Papaver somniferum TaxID=3469 RepID=UPI000E703E41|nr:uncharacterized protein LOC113361060 [Papaver somniferum]